MKPHLICLVLSILLTTIAPAQNARIPDKGAETIGAISGINIYTSHVALGRVAAADVKEMEDLKFALQQAGGIKGGNEVVIDYLKQASSLFSKQDQAQVKQVLALYEMMDKQATVVITLLRIKHAGGDTKKAEASYAEVRKSCGASIAKLLELPAELVK